MVNKMLTGKYLKRKAFRGNVNFFVDNEKILPIPPKAESTAGKVPVIETCSGSSGVQDVTPTPPPRVCTLRVQEEKELVTGEGEPTI